MTKTAYQKLQEYRDSISAKLQNLKNEQNKLKQQVDQTTAEMTTATGLLSESDKKTGHLKELRADLAMIDDYIAAVEKHGGLNGILQQDEHMQQLAAAVYADNIKQLDDLSAKKADLTAKIRQQLEQLGDLEAAADRHDAAVTMLENQIDAVKPFLVDKKPVKVAYKHKGAHFPRDYRAAFSDIKTAAKLLQRSDSGKGVK